MQTAKQNLTTSKKSIEFNYSDFPCHLKVNRDKLALINGLGKCKKGERLTITTNSFTKIDQLDGFRPLWWSGWKNSARSRNQSDCRICWIPPAHELRIVMWNCKNNKQTKLQQRDIIFAFHPKKTVF